MERAIRPSRRESRWRLGRGGIVLLTVAVSAAALYAFPSWIESRKPEVGKPAVAKSAVAKPEVAKSEIAKSTRPATVDESPRAASGERSVEVRQAHLRELQPILRADAGKLSEIARRIRLTGRVTDLAKGPSGIAAEMTSLFVSHRDLSGDLENHFQEYAQAKERLRRNVAAHEEEFHKAASLVMTDLALPPGTEHRRPEVARAVLERCLDKGPESPIAVADDERGVLEALASFVPAPAVVTHCESLKKRAAGLAANARKLSADAQALAGRTTLLGECAYTRRE